MREEFGGLGTIAEIADCTLLGGHGWSSPAFEPGASCTLSFTTEGLWVRPPSGWQPLIRSPYQEATALEFSGPGRQSSGGRFFGGGLGLLGVAEGLVAATVLNTLTARTTIHTTVRYQAVNLEAFFFCSTETPDQLRVRLSKVLSMVEPPAPRGEPAGISSELAKLAELHAKGALTDEEFATLKARLIGAL